MKIIKQSVKLLWITSNPEKQIERAGRTCYKSEYNITVDSAYKFCKSMREKGHHAMLEHAVASFRIITDRGISHEIVRHRLASYAQESTRYCNYSQSRFNSECSFIEPPNLSFEQRHIWLRACKNAEKDYFDLLNNDCSPQIARAVLPNCLKTELVMTANLREWRHFIRLRSALNAHPQIRPIAKKILQDLLYLAPAIFEDLYI